MAKRKRAVKTSRVDGMSEKDVKNIRRLMRQAWSWSGPWRIAKERNIGKDGFPRCEKCKRKVPKTYVDHLVTVGGVDSGFIERMFVPSIYLQNLCGPCHKVKTKADNKVTEGLRLDKLDFK